MSYIQNDSLLTVKEVSDFLKLSALTIYKYIRENELEASEFGGHFRIKKSSLDAFIERHKVTSESSVNESNHYKENLTPREKEAITEKEESNA